MTNPVGKNWPNVQTVDGALSLAPGAVVSVQNPTAGMFPPILVPLLVSVQNPGGPVRPEVPNFPSVNRFAADLPMDGSSIDLILYKGAPLAAPYLFRDVAADGDVREFCGGLLPSMRVYFYNFMAVTHEVIVVFTEGITANGNIVHQVSNSYSTGFFNTSGMIELAGTVHVPSYAEGSIAHSMRLEAYVNGGHSEAKYGFELVLCSHYDIEGLPS